MNHDQLKEKVRKAFGTTVPVAAKERWSVFARERRTEIALRYDWIRDPRFYTWVHDHPEMEFGEGTEWITVWILEECVDVT